MPKSPRRALGGEVYHVLNRASARFTMFRTEKDYAAFETVVLLALQRSPIRLLTYCIMPNHWHMVLWPQKDGELSTFMNWLTLTHAQRWRHAHETVGYGGLYQDRFKSFPIQQDRHFLIVCRYVERNPLRANLVANAQEWRWSALWHRQNPGHDLAQHLTHDWPVPRSDDWMDWLNIPQTTPELDALRTSVTRGRPFGQATWQRETATRHNLLPSLNQPGRPSKMTFR
jgi:putative transposase